MFGSRKALPAHSSVLAPGPLLEAAREHYGIERGATCELLHRGVHETYLITARGSGDRMALRVYRHGWREHGAIQWELSLLEHLDAEGAPVAAPIRTRSGNRFAIVLAQEGPRPVALFQHAAGKPCAAESISQPHARAFGQSLASVHLRMDTFQPQYPRFELDLDNLLTKPVTSLAPYMADREHDVTYLRRLTDDIKEAIVEFDDRGLGRGLCHGDATTASAHLDQRGEFTFFGFDNAGPGWRAYDLATFRWQMLRSLDRRKADETFDAFLEGYREVRGLPRLEEDAVPPFVAACQLRDMGLYALMAATEGRSRLNDRYFDRSINFLHDWYKEMLAYS